MSFVAESKRNKFWFGTENKMTWFPTPLRGADVSPSGWSASNDLLNGGGHQLNSFGSHKNYIFEWSGASSREVAQRMKSYADGSYGRGLIYFIDPLTFDTNVLPAMWADPSMGVGQEGASLVYGIDPLPAPTSNWRANELPVTSAFYDLSGVTPGWRGKEDAVFIPVPEGYSLSLGAFYQFSGSGGLFYRTQSQSGALGNVQSVTPLSNDSPEVLNTLIGGSNISGVWLFVGRSTSANSSVTLTAMIARLIETSKTVSQKVATNLFTNPNLVGDGTYAEVRRNYCRGANPSASTSGWINGSSSVWGDVTVDGRELQMPSAANAVILSRNADTPAVPGDVWSAGFEVRNPGATPVTVFAGVWAWGSSNLGTFNGDPVTIEPGAVEVVPIQGAVMPVGTLYVRPTLSGLSMPAGTVVVVRDSITLEKASVLGGLFSGSTTPETAVGVVQPEDFRWRWLGAENASESVMEIERVRGLSTANAVAGVSTWEGEPAVRIIPTGASQSSRAYITIPAAARVSGTALATVQTREELPSPIAVRLSVGSLNPGTFTAAPTNGPGSYPLRHHFSSLDSSYHMSLWHGSRGGESWWTDIGLFAGDYTGPAFAGDTEAVVINGRNLRTQWDGTPNNSTSSAWTRTPDFDKLKLGPWIGGQGHSGCRFIGKPTYMNNTGVDGGQVSFAASFKEVGSWING